MGSSIASLGALAQVGRLAGALRPTITNRVASHEHVDMHTRMLRSLATSSTSRGVSPLSELAQQIAETQLATARLSSERSGNAFNDRSLVSANEAIVTGSAADGVDFARFTVQVNALASTQINLGTKMESSDATPVAPGTNTFSITTDNVTHLIRVPVDSNGTNRETLSGITRQITRQTLASRHGSWRTAAARNWSCGPTLAVRKAPSKLWTCPETRSRPLAPDKWRSRPATPKWWSTASRSPHPTTPSRLASTR